MEITGKTTVFQAKNAYLKQKFEGGDYSKAHEKGTRSLLQLFSDFCRGSQAVENISVAQINQWVSEAKAVNTKRNRKMAVHAFFDWLWRRDAVKENPVKKADKIRGKDRVIKCLSLEQCEASINYALEIDRTLFPLVYLELGFGLRRPETKAAEIMDSSIVIGAKHAKVGQRRVIEVPDWLKPVPADLTVTDYTLRERVDQLKNWVDRRVEGSEWPINAFRHTAITHWLNIEQNVEKVAWVMGNSPHVIRMHYNALASHHQTKQFQDLWQQALRD